MFALRFLGVPFIWFRVLIVWFVDLLFLSFVVLFDLYGRLGFESASFFSAVIIYLGYYVFSAVFFCVWGLKYSV